MTLHILKMAVGVPTVARLSEIQRERLQRSREQGGDGELRHMTRNTPRRADEILGGGSIYWIVKGLIRVRQRILRLDRIVNAEGRRRCAIILDPELIATAAVPHRSIQGWRYFDGSEAPLDRGDEPREEASLPPEMAAELRELGLL